MDNDEPKLNIQNTEESLFDAYIKSSNETKELSAVEITKKKKKKKTKTSDLNDKGENNNETKRKKSKKKKPKDEEGEIGVTIKKK